MDGKGGRLGRGLSAYGLIWAKTPMHSARKIFKHGWWSLPLGVQQGRVILGALKTLLALDLGPGALCPPVRKKEKHREAKTGGRMC